jgi:membrane protein DedA with SNARE-associated domain
VDPLLALIIMGLLVFAEDALFVGFVVPGETAAVLGGVVASRGAGAGQSAGRPEP